MPGPPDDDGFGKSLRDFLTDLTPATRSGYETALARHVLPVFGNTPVKAIQPADVRRFVTELADRRAPGTVRNSYFLLKAILDLAVTDGAIKTNPAAGLARARNRVLPRSRKQEQHFLTAGKVQRLADAHADHYRTLILTAAYTGLRAGELAALRVRNVDLLRKRLLVKASMTYVEGQGYVTGETKNRQDRVVPLPGFLTELLQARIANDPDAYVFTDSKGEHLRHNTFYRRHFKPALKRAGLPATVRFHDLRHTAASLLIQQGAHPKAVCDWLGHSTITITMDRYGHLYPGDLENLAGKLDAAYRAGTGEDVVSNVVEINSDTGRT